MGFRGREALVGCLIRQVVGKCFVDVGVMMDDTSGVEVFVSLDNKEVRRILERLK
jgi:hypothetical protein